MLLRGKDLPDCQRGRAVSWVEEGSVALEAQHELLVRRDPLRGQEEPFGSVVKTDKADIGRAHPWQG